MSANGNSLARTWRNAAWQKLADFEKLDLAVIGGGATGLGIALDAALRGLKVGLFERHDFGAGTSSRSTKLVHGGVRYLAQGQLALVREALHERSLLLANAPHIAQACPFVMPCYAWWEKPFFGMGLKAYDALAGQSGLGNTRFLDATDTRQVLPNVRQTGLKGSVQYWDGQFDDARLALALAQTASVAGAVVLNHTAATGLIQEDSKIKGLQLLDNETGQTHRIAASCVVNATGVWVDEVAQLESKSTSNPRVLPSRGSHIVVDASFMPTDQALLVPKTRDGRVLFMVPWLGKLILGTTDSPHTDLAHEPTPSEQDIDFILIEAARYLLRSPSRADARSVWAGLRPLVEPADPDKTGQTAQISREHSLWRSKNGLITITGGKWTTYRAMAEDALAMAMDNGQLPKRAGGITQTHRLIGAHGQASNAQVMRNLHLAQGLHSYGSLAEQLASLPGSQRDLGGGLTEGMVRHAVRHEFARTVEDVLARRNRLLFLDAKAAAAAAPEVAKVMQEETATDVQTEPFLAQCKRYSI